MKLTLAMMVKNEGKTLPRLLSSVEGLVDSITVLDTGSVDETIPLLKDRGATILQEPFVNFAVSRSRLCEFAKDKADYMLLADADFVFKNNGFNKEKLTNHCYNLMLHSGNLTYALPRILKCDRNWKFEGVVHEFIKETEGATTLDTLEITHLHDGFRSYQNKFLQDLLLLTEAHLKNPTEPRTVFYLAQTMRDLGMIGCAILYYQQRAGMAGTWEEERWYAQREAARLARDIPALYAAYMRRPWRAEPLMDITKIEPSPFLDNLRRSIPYPPKDDRLFIEKAAYK